MWFAKLCFISLCFCANIQISSSSIVDTNVGTISGVQGIDFISFLGIPYGVVDDKNPFAAATPAPPFNTTYLAHEDPVICPQLVKNVPAGNIHCLNLNIYVPNNSYSGSSLPVMIYIHGGGFVEGDGNLKTYSPKFLMKNDVIIVTVNYRLGPYGFICLPGLYSNQGLKDQALAFDWVKHNIKYFGGNQDNIIIFGHSAGACAVDTHLLFNEKKVFNKAILQSGFIVSPVMIKDEDESYLTEVTKALGFDVKDKEMSDIINVLSSIDANILINQTGHDIFRPCIDNDFIKKTAKINLKGIKVLLGNTIREGLFFYNDKVPAYQFFSLLPEETFSEVKDYYFKGSNIKNDAIDFGTDLIFNYPIERSLRYYAGNADAVYRYIFTYEGKRNFIKVRDNITAPGATHGDELGYLFDADFLSDIISKEDEAMINTMTKLWTDFAKFGSPDDSWPSVDKVSKFYKIIGSTISTEKNFFQNKTNFWDDLYLRYGGCLNGVDYGEEYRCKKNKLDAIN